MPIAADMAGLHKSFGPVRAFRGVDLRLDAGAFSLVKRPRIRTRTGIPVTEPRLSSRAVSVGAVRDGGDNDRDLLVLDQVQHPVFAPARRVLRRERLKERPADPVRAARSSSARPRFEVYPAPLNG
jgi:hypothetical protein